MGCHCGSKSSRDSTWRIHTSRFQSCLCFSCNKTHLKIGKKQNLWWGRSFLAGFAVLCWHTHHSLKQLLHHGVTEVGKDFWDQQSAISPAPHPLVPHPWVWNLPRDGGYTISLSMEKSLLIPTSDPNPGLAAQCWSMVEMHKESWQNCGHLFLFLWQQGWTGGSLGGCPVSLGWFWIWIWHRGSHLSGKCHSGTTSDQWQPAVTDHDVVSKGKKCRIGF